LDHDAAIRTPIGCTLSFRGDRLQHGGEAVTCGVRYILAVFLYCDVAEGDESIQSSGLKRSFGEINRIIQESKQQKTEFSFGFSLGK